MIALSERAHDQLKHKLATWREEVRVNGDKTLLTQRHINRLEKRVERLYTKLDALNRELDDIMEM